MRGASLGTTARPRVLSLYIHFGGPARARAAARGAAGWHVWCNAGAGRCVGWVPAMGVINTYSGSTTQSELTHRSACRTIPEGGTKLRRETVKLVSIGRRVCPQGQQHAHVGPLELQRMLGGRARELLYSGDRTGAADVGFGQGVCVQVVIDEWVMVGFRSTKTSKVPADAHSASDGMACKPTTTTHGRDWIDCAQRVCVWTPLPGD